MIDSSEFEVWSWGSTGLARVRNKLDQTDPIERAIIGIAILNLLVIIALPLGLMINGSFTDANPGVPSLYTLDVYLDVFGSEWFLTAFSHTLVVSTGTTFLSLAMGTALAWIVTRTNTPFSAHLEIPLTIPFFLSPFLGGIAWGLLGNPQAGLLNLLAEQVVGVKPFDVSGRWGIIWVMSLYYAPYAFLLVSGSLRKMDPSLEEASRICQAGLLTTTRRITLPIMSPSILAAALLIFVSAAGQFGVPAVLGMKYGYQVLPTRIYMMTQRYPLDFSSAAATGVLLTLITGLLLFVRNRYLSRRSYVTMRGDTEPVTLDLGWFRWLTFGVAMVYLGVAVVLPIGVIVVASFLKYFTVSVTPDILTLQNWRFILFEYSVTINAIKNSILLALTSTVGGILLAVVVSWLVIRTNITGRGLLDGLGTVPIAVPGLVMGLAYVFLGLRSPVPIYGTVAILGVAYVARFLPYGLRSTASSLRQIDPALEEVAAICGAPWHRRYRDILLPLLKTGIASGFILMFVSSIRELGVSILLYSSGSEVLSVAMFDLWNDGQIGELAAVATIQLSLTIIALALLSRYAGISVLSAVQDN